ncbi:glycoside hydrolase family 88 protein [Zunongwangia sp. F260]|uniref:Glycoside hydrolase family 88 protein n=1 Tax=Autumnicola lenta TaxID=3075593 RepID=A0ABU3CNS5_9FLAO|nr:glycoside hydrolase family 88 protein [Zunongwangia sp. F260]MDT0648002.1 glycoside hydrolase family 88 protein [Zunongwangia sp. F260]
MSRISYCFIISFIVLVGCKESGTNREEETAQPKASSLLEARYQKLLEYEVDSTAYPQSMSMNIGEIVKTGSNSWISGFFPGNLWQLYELTGNEKFKSRAVNWTAFLEKEKMNNTTHDIGFVLMGSFGKGLEIEEKEEYKDILIQGARTLSTRFNEKVGALRSWDFNKEVWEYPVIIDNMMNLELLFEATKLSNDSSFHQIAVKHANTTLKNHFREDHSAYHLVVYDTISGAVKEKITHQGFNDESSWARGHAWAVYGYTMSYRYTQDTAYLKQATAMADYFINHESLPEDGIPYWDFKDPQIPDAPRDVSAATIMASALFELSSYAENEDYQKYSEKVLNSLHSEKYILSEDVQGPFILKHSTGHWPHKKEIDEPIIYADYYFLEAKLREKKR